MLIDTSALIFYALSPKKMTKRAVGVIQEVGNYYSHVSVWELAIKSGLGKIRLSAAGKQVNAKQFILTMVHSLNLRALPVEFDDLADVEALPQHHGDPFDRLLVVQAQRAGLPIVSPDKQFDAYDINRVW
jgi:PIN domain nuclease of toxin-antitoxin system